jgi:hypothetical protein
MKGKAHKGGCLAKSIEALMKMKEKGVFVGIWSYASRTGTDREYYKKIHEFAREIEVHNVIFFDSVLTSITSSYVNVLFNGVCENPPLT